MRKSRLDLASKHLIDPPQSWKNEEELVQKSWEEKSMMKERNILWSIAHIMSIPHHVRHGGGSAMAWTCVYDTICWCKQQDTGWSPRGSAQIQLIAVNLSRLCFTQSAKTTQECFKTNWVGQSERSRARFSGNQTEGWESLKQQLEAAAVNKRGNTAFDDFRGFWTQAVTVWKGFSSKQLLYLKFVFVCFS